MTEKNKKITIIINKKPFHFTQNIISAEIIRGKVEADPDYEVWLIIKEPDPEGQLPKNDQLITGDIEIKSGMRFRVVPPGTFGVYYDANNSK